MRKLLVATAAVVAVVFASTSAGAADRVVVSTGAKLGSNTHVLTLGVKIRCNDNKDLDILAKARQDGAIAKGTSSVKCSNGDVKTLTVDVSNDTHTYTTGPADA